jgi:hypothetical protein
VLSSVWGVQDFWQGVGVSVAWYVDIPSTESLPAADKDKRLGAFRYWQIFGRLPTASPDLQLAKTWLEECLQHHPKCLRPRTTIHPPRLLDLENAEDTPDLRLALRPMDRGPYATLSHCWGSSQPLRLLQANLEEFAAGIQFARLPKTFQDAVTATRALGLRYLWIVSLCILQDSAADWEEHCSEMANIYRRSYVTLAGPLSSGCDTGLLHTRPQIDDPVTLKLDDEGEEVEVQLDYHHLQGNSYYFGPEPDSPLSKRAWVFQERILSGRTLYFGKSRMYLECHTNVHFEDCHWPVQWDEDKVGGMVVKRPLQDMHPMSSDVFKYWYSLVSTYSGLNLTKQTDKLPAFSGMASLFGQILKDEYIAGHWREDLLRSLVWTISPEDKVSGGSSKSGITAETYIAPSWSWASSPWKVKMVPNSGRQFGPSLEIHDVKVAPAGQDAHGMVQRGGYMDVSGLVMRGTVKRTGPRTGEFRSGRFTTDTVEWDWDDRGDGCGAVEGGDEFDVHLLQIGSCDYYHWMIIQLAVNAESGSGNGEDCWRRIGMTSHYGGEGKLEEVRRTEKEHKRLRLI